MELLVLGLTLAPIWFSSCAFAWAVQRFEKRSVAKDGSCHSPGHPEGNTHVCLQGSCPLPPPSSVNVGCLEPIRKALSSESRRCRAALTASFQGLGHPEGT